MEGRIDVRRVISLDEICTALMSAEYDDMQCVLVDDVINVTYAGPQLRLDKIWKEVMRQ